MQKPRKIRLQFSRRLAPGDYVVTTSLLRDIQRLHPGKFRVAFDSGVPAVYAYNPHVSDLSPADREVETVQIGYGAGISACKQGHVGHFTAWLHKEFSETTGIKVWPTRSRPDLHLSEYERKTRPISGRYWVVFGGGKTDFTVKHWDYSRYREVVQSLQKYKIACIQSGATGDNHIHPPIPEALDLVGWGYLREMFWQIYHADGVICPITCAMHVAAAFEKPCVVVAGGRENWTWEAYTNEGQFGDEAEPIRVPHRFLHTIGQLDCCLAAGCWKNKLTPTAKDQSVCVNPAVRPAGAQLIPECMNLVSVEKVVDAVLSYYRDGTLTSPTHRDTRVQLLVDDVPWQPQADTVFATATTEVGTRRQGLLVNNDKIGGKITVATYLPGDNAYLNRMTLRGILDTVPRLNLDWHILTTVDGNLPANLLEELPAKVFIGSRPGGFACLRDWLRENPLTSNYLVWFVAGTKIHHRDWLNQFCETVVAQGPKVAGYGVKHSYSLSAGRLVGFEPWVRSRPWYRGLPLATRNGVPQVTGLSDWFFSVRRDAIDKIGFPDETLKDAGGGIVLAEQLRQHDFKTMSFNVGYSCFSPPVETAEKNMAEPVGPWSILSSRTVAGTTT